MEPRELALYPILLLYIDNTLFRLNIDKYIFYRIWIYIRNRVIETLCILCKSTALPLS